MLPHCQNDQFLMYTTGPDTFVCTDDAPRFHEHDFLISIILIIILIFCLFIKKEGIK